MAGRWCIAPTRETSPTAAIPEHCLYFHYALGVCHPNTRMRVGLLGPCFKTGRLKPFRQRPEVTCAKHPRARTQLQWHSVLSQKSKCHGAKLARPKGVTCGSLSHPYSRVSSRRAKRFHGGPRALGSDFSRLPQR